VDGVCNFTLAASGNSNLKQVLIDADYTVPAMEVELAEVRQTFETNLFAVITMCQTFLPLLIKAKGTIVQIGSVAGVCLRYPSSQILSY
jgi:NAD(P)-dependent dehydrogenase (short-subunit alcohol dehydrogenase family)